MNDAQRRVARLRTIEGHIRGVQRMEREGAYCIDIIRQVQAVQAALDKFSAVVLEHHLATCVTDAIRSQEEVERERVVGELLRVYAPLTAGEQHGEPFSTPRLDYLQQIESDVQRIEQLVQAQAYCIDVIQSAQQAKAALQRFNTRILADHLKGCVTDAVRSDQVAERQQKLGELLQVFTTANSL